MEEELTKLNTITHKFGHTLLDQGIKFIRIAYKLKPVIFTRATVLEFLKDQTGITTNSLSLADEKYYVESWGKWGAIIDYDLIDQQIYHYDYSDCDNYSFLYASRASMIYGLNSCGVCFGKVYDAKTGKYLNCHAFNLILTQDNGVLHLYLYEPQTDNSVLWQKGKDNILQNPNWKYTCDWILMF